MSQHVVLALIGVTVLALLLITVAAFVYVPPTLSDEEENEENRPVA
jgi:hypothetical protein